MLRRGSTFLAGLAVGLLSAGLLYLLISPPRGHPVELLPPPTLTPLQVHVAGAVRNPGVHSVPRGAIVQQAVDAAGGMLPEALVESINLAAPLGDGQQVYVPWKLATPQPGDASTPAPVVANPGTGVNVNSASVVELDLLPGIGPTLAQNIVDFRERHGPFRKPEDLLQVPGIGPAKLEAIRDLITFR